MAIPKFDADLNIISSMGDYPREDDGLETEDFKKRFDIAGNLLKQYINEVLIPNLDAIVDVDALLKSILDPTMTSTDMAAQSKAVGLRLNALRAEVGKAIERVHPGGDFAVPTAENFRAYFTGDNSVLVNRGACIMQGNFIELPSGYSATLNFKSGLGGTFRSDLICLRVTRDQDGNDEYGIVLIPGTESISGFFDPEYNTGDMNSGAAVRDFPIYRLKMDGVSASLEPLFSAEMAKVITLLPADWTDNVQTVKAAGVNTSCHVVVSPSADSYEAYCESGVRCTGQGDGTLTFACSYAPGSDVSVNVLIVH